MCLPNMTTCHIWHNENNEIKVFSKIPHKDQCLVLVRVLP